MIENHEFLPPVSVRSDGPFPTDDKERHAFNRELLERLWRKMEEVGRTESHKFIMLEDFDTFVQARAEEHHEQNEFYRFCVTKFGKQP